MKETKIKLKLFMSKPKQVSLTVNLDDRLVEHLKELALQMSAEGGKKLWVSDLVRRALDRIYPMPMD